MKNHHIWEHRVIGPVSTNCFVFGQPDEAVMVDPGGIEAGNIAKKLLEHEIEIKHVLVTHGHFDHLGFANEVLNVIEGAKVYLHEDEKETYEDFINVMPLYGLPQVEIREPDVWIRDNQILNISGLTFKIIHTPGHSPGSVTYHLQSEENNNRTFLETFNSTTAFVGDCVFKGSIGRIDLPYANPQDMLNSLNRLMNELSNDTQLYPGHGEKSEMANEIKNNPYLLAIQKGIPIF